MPNYSANITYELRDPVFTKTEKIIILILLSLYIQSISGPDDDELLMSCNVKSVEHR